MFLRDIHNSLSSSTDLHVSYYFFAKRLLIPCQIACSYHYPLRNQKICSINSQRTRVTLAFKCTVAVVTNKIFAGNRIRLMFLCHSATRQNVPSNNELLDFGRTFLEPEAARVSVDALNRSLFRIPPPPMNTKRQVGHPPHHVEAE